MKREERIDTAEGCEFGLASHGLRIRGSFVRVATRGNDWYEDITDPEAMIRELRAGARRVDLFCFVQRPPLTASRLPYHAEVDHVAAIPISSHDHWWNHQVIKKVRKNVRRSQKAGIQVREVVFDDALIRGILEINREVPVRSGRPFKHYNDDFETCRRKHESYLERSVFLGAFLEDRLVGYMKLVRAGRILRSMQFICLDAFRDLSPANALLSQAVQLCADRGITHLAYGKMTYGKLGNVGLEEFKVANGFVRLDYLRYYIPLTFWGALCLRAGVHRGLVHCLPKSLLQFARSLRSRHYARRVAGQPGSGKEWGCVSEHESETAGQTTQQS